MLDIARIKEASERQQQSAASHLPECESCNIVARAMADEVPALLKEIERLRDAIGDTPTPRMLERLIAVGLVPGAVVALPTVPDIEPDRDLGGAL